MTAAVKPAQSSTASPAASRALRLKELTGDTPQENLRKLEWAIWSALGDMDIQDAGPRYESAEFLAAHLYVNGALIID